MAHTDASDRDSIRRWERRVFTLSRLTGISAVVFALSYGIGVVNLAAFAAGVGIPFEVIRQDPIAIGTSVLFLVLPVLGAVLIWRGYYAQYKAWRTFIDKHARVVVPAVLLLGLASAAYLWFSVHNYGVAVQTATVLLLYAYLGAPISLDQPTRAALLAAILAVSSALFGWAHALELRTGLFPRPMVTVSSADPILGLDGFDHHGGWQASDLVFVYQDLKSLYLLPASKPTGPVVIVPIERVTAVSVQYGSK